MFDWLLLLRNALWILGLAVSLAAWSHGRWWAHRNRVQLRRMVTQPLFVIPFSAGLTVFCLGLALGGRSWWDTLLWSILTLLSAAQGLSSWLTKQQQR